MTGINVSRRVHRAILREDLLPRSSTLVVGVSGGTDSLALLHILAALRDSLRLQLHVATLDHGLRGAAGAADAEFVVETARAWGLEVTAGYADVGGLAQARQIGIEAAARLARYDFLAGVAESIQTKYIAVAHNADDQVETVLLHLLRGSGVGGLRGMEYSTPLPGHADLTLIRPLLDVSRADLDAYCREQGLQPRYDASNADVIYTRNRLRHEILPLLRVAAPQFERNLLQLADIARVEDDFADSALHQAIDAHIKREEGRISLPRTIFVGLHPALQRRLVVWAVRRLSREQEVDYRRVIAAVELASRGKRGARAQFSGGIQLRVDYTTLVIERAAAPLPENVPRIPAAALIPVAVPGSTVLDDQWSLQMAFSPFAESGLLAVHEESKIILRGRRRGDRFAPFGLKGHTQRVSEWMIDRKIPASLRDGLPLLVIEQQVAAIWWQTWYVSHDFAVRENTQHVIYFQLHQRRK